MTYTSPAARIADAIAAHENARRARSARVRIYPNAYTERTAYRVERADGWALELTADCNDGTTFAAIYRPHAYDCQCFGMGATANAAVADLIAVLDEMGEYDGYREAAAIVRDMAPECTYRF